MRDAQNSLYSSYDKDYLGDIANSYNAIQKRSEKILFDQSKIDMKYENSTYNGTLNELTQVILSQIHEFIKTNNFQTVTFIHESVINDLIEEINQYNNQIQKKINSHIKNLLIEKDIYLFSILGGNLIFYICLICLACKVQEMIKKTLLEILLMSDAESKAHLDMVQKIKSSLLELKKSSEINVQSLSSERTIYPNRIKPKKSKLDKKTSAYLGILIAFFFVLNLVILMVYKIEVQNALTELDTMLTQGKSLMSIYLKTSETVIILDFSASFSSKKLKEQIQQIDSSLSLIENERRSLKFSHSFTNFINTFFFEDSCSKMIEKSFISGEGECSNTCQGFNIQAPFKIGASSYFRYIKYHLTKDLREAYAATGIFSEPFRNVFCYFSNQIEQQGKKYIQKSFSFINLLNVVLFVLSIFNFSISAIILLYLKPVISTVKELVYSLNFTKKSQQKNEVETFDQNEILEQNQDEEKKLINGSQLEDIDD